VIDLLAVLEFSLHEVTLTETASAASRAEASHALDQILLLTFAPVLVGTVARVLCAAAAFNGLGFGPTTPARAGYLLPGFRGVPPIRRTVEGVRGNPQRLWLDPRANIWLLTTLGLDLLAVVVGLEARLS
jgi:hypothetical protein